MLASRFIALRKRRRHDCWRERNHSFRRAKSSSGIGKGHLHWRRYLSIRWPNFSCGCEGRQADLPEGNAEVVQFEEDCGVSDPSDFLLEGMRPSDNHGRWPGCPQRYTLITEGRTEKILIIWEVAKRRGGEKWGRTRRRIRISKSSEQHASSSSADGKKEANWWEFGCYELEIDFP